MGAVLMRARRYGISRGKAGGSGVARGHKTRGAGGAIGLCAVDLGMVDVPSLNWAHELRKDHTSRVHLSWTG